MAVAKGNVPLPESWFKDLYRDVCDYEDQMVGPSQDIILFISVILNIILIISLVGLWAWEFPV